MDSTEVLTPIWVLKAVVEKEHEDWMFFNSPENMLEEDEPEDFPLNDSTKRCLEILEKYNIVFDKQHGEWLDI